MVQAIAKDDFEVCRLSKGHWCPQECEDAIMQGADVNADCGAGMCALHISALRGRPESSRCLGTSYYGHDL